MCTWLVFHWKSQYSHGLNRNKRELNKRGTLAGIAGFEPANVGVKGRCLTAWRYSYVEFQTRIELALATWKDADLTISPLERVLLRWRVAGEKLNCMPTRLSVSIKLFVCRTRRCVWNVYFYFLHLIQKIYTVRCAFGAPSGIRTHDFSLKRRVLYQLSYWRILVGKVGNAPTKD